MVKVEEVKDAHFEDNESDYETSSSVSDDDSDAVSIASSAPDEPETLSERFYALKDMIPPSTRLSVVKTFGQASSWAKWTGKAAGNVVWVVTTTALLVGLPMAIAIEDETRLVAQEKEMLGQQQGQAGMLPPPSGQTSLVPPGF